MDFIDKLKMLLPIVLILLGGICYGIVYLLRRKHLKFVAEHSPKLKKIRELNQKYSFIVLSPTEYYTKRCTSKTMFDRTDVYQIFLSYVSENLNACKQLLTKTQKNQEFMDHYLIEFKKIMTSPISQKFHNQYKYFYQIENNLCRSEKANPVLHVSFCIFCEYSSPQGRNHYSKTKTYDIYDLRQAIDTLEQQAKQKNMHTCERNKMNDSLRYDILKRDHFRCVLCGRTANDGVKLQVDHIIPIAKGGKTEKENLRTLCENCNFGKSDKYDPYGFN